MRLKWINGSISARLIRKHCAINIGLTWNQKKKHSDMLNIFSILKQRSNKKSEMLKSIKWEAGGPAKVLIIFNYNGQYLYAIVQIPFWQWHVFSNQLIYENEIVHVRLQFERKGMNMNEKQKILFAAINRFFTFSL